MQLGLMLSWSRRTE